MKLPFGKDKGREEQEKIDAVIMSDYEDQDAVLKPAGDGGDDDGSSDSGSLRKADSEAVRRIAMDVEKIRAQTEALMQLRSINEERFTRMSEEIGDLRRRLLDKEKDLTQLRVEASKTTELVSAVQPQNLLKELKKEDTKVEAVKAKLEAVRAIVDSLVGEIKSVKNTLSTFKGTEMLLKLNEDVKAELNSIKKVEIVVEKHANKVESIFGSVQERFNDFVKLSDRVSVIDSSFKKIQNEFSGVLVKMEDFAKKDDFVKFTKEIDDATKTSLNRLKGLDNLGKQFEREVESARKKHSKRLYEIETRTDNRISEIEAYTKDLSEMLETMIMIEQENLRAMQTSYKRLEDIFSKGSVQPKIDEPTKRLLKKVSDQLRENHNELARNIGLIDSLGK